MSVPGTETVKYSPKLKVLDEGDVRNESATDHIIENTVFTVHTTYKQYKNIIRVRGERKSGESRKYMREKFINLRVTSLATTE